MANTAADIDPTAREWLTEPYKTIVKGLTGIIAIVVALKAIVYEPNAVPMFAHEEHAFRMLAFAALTVWTTLTFGVKRRGIATVTVLIFATFVELILMPARGFEVYTMASSNLGIAIAYCCMQLYWLSLRDRLKTE
ncbi:MAG: hypothetical protein AAGI14_00650 [Pseudomonadota bacterium]